MQIVSVKRKLTVHKKHLRIHDHDGKTELKPAENILYLSKSNKF